jgi:hypothetical protein
VNWKEVKPDSDMKEAEFAVFSISIGIGENPVGDLKLTVNSGDPIGNLWINLKKPIYIHYSL